MGFRSTFITEDVNLFIPQWFVEKWGDQVQFQNNKEEITPFAVLPLSSKYEAKTYDSYLSLEDDLQILLKEDENWKDGERALILIYLHECGGITRLEIYPDKIIYTEPTGWKKTDGVEHDYCYGCSDSSKATGVSTSDPELSLNITPKRGGKTTQ